MNTKPRLFIGSASETLEVAESIRDGLKSFADVDLWSEGTFKSGDYTIEALVKQANKSDFGIFVVGSPDSTKSRGKEELSPRDNVVYEAGRVSRNHRKKKDDVSSSLGHKNSYGLERFDLC